MKPITLGSIELDLQRPYLIAEAGVNHEGSLDTAVALIEAAAEAGADAIKFQSYKAETLASKNSPAYWDRSKESCGSQFELFKKFDAFGDAEYQKLAAVAEASGIVFCSTPFDHHFVDALDPLMPFFKVASADLTNVLLLRKIAQKNKPVILSTGASTLDEVDAAVRLLRDECGVPLALLHCVLQYPTPPGDCHLNTMAVLQERYPDIPIGWSDHTPPVGACLSLVAAWSRGAALLEEHFTLDKSLPGNDHYHAMDPDDIRAFRDAVSYFNALGGGSVFDHLDEQADARKYARRSLVSARAIAAGTAVVEDDLIAKRPGTGIHPAEWAELIGSVAQVDIAEDTILDWSLFQRS